MLVRVVCAAVLVLGPSARAYAAGAMPAPSAAASAHCPEMVLVHVDRLPASAWAAVDYPTDAENALREKSGDAHLISAASVHVFRQDATGTVSVVAEKAGGGWTLWVADGRGGKLSSRKAVLRNSRELDRILADACFWAEPTDLSSATADATCSDPMDIHFEAIVPQGRRVAVQSCSPVGLTGEVAGLLWNATGVE